MKYAFIDKHRSKFSVRVMYRVFKSIRYVKGGKTASIADNILDRNFNPDTPNKSWVSDITYVRTYEGFYICCDGH